MQKRLMILLILFLLISSTGWSSAFSGIGSGVIGTPGYYPENTVMFAAITIDEAHISQLNTIIRAFSRNFNELGIPNMTIEQMITLGSGVNAQRALEWLGETASFGITATEINGQPTPEMILIVIDIVDQDAARLFLTETMNLSGVDDIYPLDSTTELALTENYITITSTPGNSRRGSGTLFNIASLTGIYNLDDTPDFQRALASMTATSYNILVYIKPEILVNASGMRSEFPQGMEAMLAPQMYGATILDEDTLVFDVVVLPLEGQEPAGVTGVNPAFTRHIPADADAVIHTRDFTELYTGLFDLAEAASVNDPSYEDPRPMIEASLAEVGIDLQADLLDWTTGDYALFIRGDVPTIAREALNLTANFENTMDFGVIMEATDPAAAQGLVDKLFPLIQQGANESGEFTVSSEEISGIPLTVMTVDVPLNNLAPAFPDKVLSVDIMLGATDAVFFIATRNAAEQIITQRTSLADSDNYQAASTYFLPDASAIWYSSGEGFIMSTLTNPLMFFAIAGPSVNMVFDSVSMSFDGTPPPTPAPTPTPLPTPTPDPDEIERVLRPLERIIALLENGSITSAVTAEGVTQFRAVLSLNLPAR